eukprot:TRINITY_DN2821_c0_g1_i3.p1 TRINITY_DN2821_c0_g1~~TRINITY_DN2821_c0_g1_i3.p1  ORF type:complete len:260 (-),score=77.30 TRINITY_DN2821_c0_g1_i3:33-812(-)
MRFSSLLLLSIVGSCSAFDSKYWKEQQDQLFGSLGIRSDAPSSQVFSPVLSLSEEDTNGLDGMHYNETQPTVKDKKEFVGKKIGFVASHCYEEIELVYGYLYFLRRGATVEIITPSWVPGKIVSCKFVRASLWTKSSRNFDQALNEKYDALLVPGGVWSSTVVRTDSSALKLIQQQKSSKRLLATVCSGTTVLINAGLTKGVPLTGSPSIRIDLENAGGNYKDQPVVSIGNLITGRSPQGRDNELWIQEIANWLNANRN